MSRKRNINKSNSDFRFSNLTKLSVSFAIIAIGLASMSPASAISWAGMVTYAKQQLATNSINDSIKTAVAQDSVTANLQGEAISMANKQKIAAEMQLQRKENMIDLYNDYLSAGSMTDTARCFSVVERAKDAAVPEKTQMMVKADLFNSMNAGNHLNEMQRSLSLSDMKSQLACTFEQGKQGYCTPAITGGEYFDTDTGLILASSRLTPNQFAAGKAGIYTIADPVGDKVVSNCETNGVCSEALANENSRLAVNSLVANSLLNQLYNRMNTGASDDLKK